MEGYPLFVRRPMCIRGFSLYELIITLLITSVLFAVVVPSMAGLITSSKVDTTKHQVIVMLAKARTEAIAKRKRVGLCKTLDHTSCAGYGRTGTSEWQNALMFLDENYNNRFDSSELLLGWFSPTAEGLKLEWNRGLVLFYDPDGTVRGGSNGTFTISTPERVEAGIIISLTGRYRSTTY